MNNNQVKTQYYWLPHINFFKKVNYIYLILIVFDILVSLALQVKDFYIFMIIFVLFPASHLLNISILFQKDGSIRPRAKLRIWWYKFLFKTDKRIGTFFSAINIVGIIVSGFFIGFITLFLISAVVTRFLI